MDGHTDGSWSCVLQIRFHGPHNPHIDVAPHTNPPPPPPQPPQNKKYTHTDGRRLPLAAHLRHCAGGDRHRRNRAPGRVSRRGAEPPGADFHRRVPGRCVCEGVVCKVLLYMAGFGWIGYVVICLPRGGRLLLKWFLHKKENIWNPPQKGALHGAGQRGRGWEQWRAARLAAAAVHG